MLQQNTTARPPKATENPRRKLSKTLEPKWLRRGGVGGTDQSEHGVSVQARVYVQLIGWQNTWEQAPGVPATMAGVSPGRVPVHTALKSSS